MRYGRAYRLRGHDQFAPFRIARFQNHNRACRVSLTALAALHTYLGLTAPPRLVRRAVTGSQPERV